MKNAPFNFSRRSFQRLNTCHDDIIAVCNELILITDFTVITGRRTQEEQFHLFKSGRERFKGTWEVVNRKKVVTYKDGFKRLSRHQTEHGEVSTAIDLAPYPIRWKNIERFQFLAGAFLGIAHRLQMQEIIYSQFEWGGHWKRFKDYPHIQIKSKI